MTRNQIAEIKIQLKAFALLSTVKQNIRARRPTVSEGSFGRAWSPDHTGDILTIIREEAARVLRMRGVEIQEDGTVVVEEASPQLVAA